MTDAERLKLSLQRLIGATVARVGLLTWPDPDAPTETDVCLYLELRRTNENDIAVIFGTSPDGQTPSLDWTRLPDGIPLSELISRKQVWGSDAFWKVRQSYSWELFVVSPKCDNPLASVNGQQIASVTIICFAGEEQHATGIHLRFGNGTDVWSIPGSSGNQVTTDSTRLCWPAAVVDYDVTKPSPLSFPSV